MPKSSANLNYHAFVCRKRPLSATILSQTLCQSATAKPSAYSKPTSLINNALSRCCRYILPLQMAPAMNSATANKAETIATSKLIKVFRDMLGLPSLPSQAFIPHANEVTRLCAGDR
jgi:hypothetical protein